MLVFAPFPLYLLLTRLALLPIETQVRSNSIQPRRKARLGSKAGQVQVGLDEGLLSQVVRVGHRAGHSITKRVNHALIFSDQALERLLIAVLAPDYPATVIRGDHARSVYNY